MINIYSLSFIFVTNSYDTKNGQCYFIIQMPCAQVTKHCYGSLCKGNIAGVSIQRTGHRHCWNQRSSRRKHGLQRPRHIQWNPVYMTYQYELPHVSIQRSGSSKMPVLSKGRCFPLTCQIELQVTGWHEMAEEAKVCWQQYAKGACGKAEVGDGAYPLVIGAWYLIPAVMGWVIKLVMWLPPKKAEVSKIHIHPQYAWYRMLEMISQSYGWSLWQTIWASPRGHTKKNVTVYLRED